MCSSYLSPLLVIISLSPSLPIFFTRTLCYCFCREVGCIAGGNIFICIIIIIPTTCYEILWVFIPSKTMWQKGLGFALDEGQDGIYTMKNNHVGGLRKPVECKKNGIHSFSLLPFV